RGRDGGTLGGDMRSAWAATDLRFVLTSGLGLLLPVAAAPLLSRLFSPSEIGSYQAWSLIAVIGGSAATARLEFRIPSARSGRRVNQIVSVGSVVAGLVLGSIVLAIILLQPEVGAFDWRIGGNL